MNDDAASDLRPAITPGEPPPESPAPGILTRFLRLFSSPFRAFVRPRTKALWLVPLIVMSLFQIMQGVLLRDLVQEKVLSSISQNDRIPEEQKEKILEQMEGSMGSPMQLALQQAGGAAGTWLLVYVVPALLFMLGLNFVLGAHVRFRDVFSVVAFSALVLLPRDLIRVPLMLAKGSLDVYTSPAALVSPDSTALVFALNLFDVFELYRLFVVAAGFVTLTGFALRKTLFPVVVVWLLYGLIGVGCMLSPLGQYMR